ncbi:prephenate dehydrogenase [Metabacillus arenae]|uniref:Prephenate dehydrogenase n=1 Tax=Metabacillus arenae TaxID=2771434 RepID=A0A926RVB0_9BACI|nr:prephenate dehydrogenase [Metabacillus arenae]MBD1378601.1 prephenate dehydrogenase [Metabacillus arenae]
MHKTVFLVGLGLIGGSIALAIKKEYPDCKILGIDIDEEQADIAKLLTVIDDKVETIEMGASAADFIILATPVVQTLSLIDYLSKMELKQKVIVTDVGSTKQKIVEHAADKFGTDKIFIGGHPMAGSHKSGITAAKPHLFENAFYVLTPSNNTDPAAIDELKKLLKGTKANLIEMAPDEHDSITGVISHFPHVIAASLVHQAERFNHEYPMIKRMAAGGFRDITRIASSSPTMWRDILLHNKEELLHLFNDWQHEMDTIRALVEAEEAEKLHDYFIHAKTYRDGLPQRQKGAIPAFYDLYIDVPDYPGVISEITGYLAKEQISITNIRIIETREEIYGVLRVSFQNEEDRKEAKACIEKYSDYDTFFGD